LFYLFYYDLVNITSLLIILAFRGGLQGFHQNAVSSIIPSMVPKDKLSNYNALSSLSNGLTEFIGPIVGAILLGVLGLENIERIFLIDVVTFCIALIPLVIITIPVISKKSKQSFYKDFKEGVSFIRKTQGLQSLLMLLVSLNLLGGFVFVGIPLIVSRDTLINGDHKTYGITMAFFSFGILITAVFLSVKKIFKNSVSGNFIGMYIAISGAYIMTLACFLKSQYVLFASTFLIGAGICVNNTNSMTIWHSVVPNELQGRVFSVRIPIVYSALTISMLYSGFLIAWYDIRFLLLIISILATLIITFTYLFSDLRNVDTSKIASDLGKELNDK
ncbi:MAG: MFS transporter, partial [Candidatus Heimdallarchaeota archaeon]|nr:MFS transporter [Candidatus Heimdallarchaeota archaeon]